MLFIDSFSLNVFLFLPFSLSLKTQFSIRTWYLNHITHHKWSDSDADPHNAKRGMFFCHAVWLFKKRHPANFLKASTLDPSPLMSDPIVYWNHHLFDVLFILTGICLPTMTGFLLTDHSLLYCFIVCYGLKHVIVTQMASLLNSAAHMFGDKPYNGKIMATDDSLLAKFSLGEGYHK